MPDATRSQHVRQVTSLPANASGHATGQHATHQLPQHAAGNSLRVACNINDAVHLMQHSLTASLTARLGACPTMDEDHIQKQAVLASRDFDPRMKRSQSFCVSVSQSEGSFQVGPSTASSN